MLSFINDFSSSPSQTRKLTLHALSETPTLTVPSDNVNLGVICRGQQACKSVSVYNPCSSDVDFAWSLSSPSAQFAISPANGVVSAKSTMQFNITFTANDVGTDTSSLSLNVKNVDNSLAECAKIETTAVCVPLQVCACVLTIAMVCYFWCGDTNYSFFRFGFLR